MQYSIENEHIRLTVDTKGAEAVSVLNRHTGAEMLWCGDSSIWGRHAPILFPYTGKLTQGKMIAKGLEYTGGQHGFGRDVQHAGGEQVGLRCGEGVRVAQRRIGGFDVEVFQRATVEGVVRNEFRAAAEPDGRQLSASLKGARGDCPERGRRDDFFDRAAVEHILSQFLQSFGERESRDVASLEGIIA